jgi:betaine reductase
MAVVIKDVSYVLVHVPDFVRYRSKPSRDIAVEGGNGPNLGRKIQESLRSFEEAVAYPPNQVFIGNLHPDALHTIPAPWYAHPVPGAQRMGKFGEILSEAPKISPNPSFPRGEFLPLAKEGKEGFHLRCLHSYGLI